MQTSELQDILIQRIQAIEDAPFLNALKVLTDVKIVNRHYKLNAFEQQKIAIARKQVKKGETFTQEDVFKSVDTWLKER